MPDRDEAVSRRYRELARDEPPRELDAAILAASRRAAVPRRARWIAPVSAAAVVVLALGVTLRMQHEQPGVETSEPARPATPPVASTTAPSPAPPPLSAPSQPAPKSPSSAQEAAAPKITQRAAPASPKAVRPRAIEEPSERSPTPFPAPPSRDALAPSRDAPAPSVAPAPKAAPAAPAVSAPMRAEAPTQKRAASALSTSGATADAASPREELERIAKLREAGRDDEADRALDEFLRAHPGYRIDDALWARVRRR